MGQGSSKIIGRTPGEKLAHLPNVESAYFDIKKLLNYALNFNNIDGGSDKAKVFMSALGFDKSNMNQLRDQILAKLPTAEAIVKTKNEFGQRYQVDIMILGVNGNTANVRTAWIILDGTDVPKLTSIYIKEKKR